MKLEGVYTALVTPMTADGALDEKALRRLVDSQIDGGVSGLVPVGTTGTTSIPLTHENIPVGTPSPAGTTTAPGPTKSPVNPGTIACALVILTLLGILHAKKE